MQDQRAAVAAANAVEPAVVAAAAVVTVVALAFAPDAAVV